MAFRTLKTKTLHCLETSGSVYISTQRHIPQGRKSRPRRYEKSNWIGKFIKSWQL